MDKNLKRKFNEHYQEAQQSPNSSEHTVVGQSLAELKSPLPRDPIAAGLAKSQADNLDKSKAEDDARASDLNDWQMAGQKDRRKPKRKRAGDEKVRTKYPELSCHGKVNTSIRIADLQALTLYTLADGVAPSWVAFKHAHHTRKVVVLMVPGLERSMFDGTITIESVSGLDAEKQFFDTVQQRSSVAKLDREDNGFHVWRNGHSAEHWNQGNPIRLIEDTLPPSCQPLAEIFDEFWPVKAPGDSRNCKIHSPIQGMLISPLPKSKENNAIKGPKPPVEEKGWQSKRTPIVDFIHTADELREADYPLHPALFDGDVEAALLEQQRREQTGQTIAAGWVDTRVSLATCSLPSKSFEEGSITAGRTVYSVDCEMVLTSDDKYSLARISIVDWNEKTILDELVRPSLPIKNYFTQFSGMTKAILDPIKTTLADIQTKLIDLFTPQSIILGHSLESDLSAMKLTHPFIVDTSLIYPHPRGPPLRSSLKFLAQKYLRREIQQHDSRGHNSVEDALAVLDLVKLKCEKGPSWGTAEAGGEPIFRRLARSKKKDVSGKDQPITSAMVDYGTPERGYGKEATVQIGCDSDEAIVAAVARAVNGDVDGKVVPGGGVDFTWARLRELESFRGWCNNNREYAIVDDLHAPVANSITTTNTNPPTDAASPAPTLPSVLKRTITHIARIHACLPPCTLLIVYSGTGDPRELGRLQKRQQLHRREFKVKKWDDLSVQWTDRDEQALRAAVETARQGLAFLCVK